jgi:hypothetical protein
VLREKDPKQIGFEVSVGFVQVKLPPFPSWQLDKGAEVERAYCGLGVSRS